MSQGDYLAVRYETGAEPVMHRRIKAMQFGSPAAETSYTNEQSKDYFFVILSVAKNLSL